MGAENRENALLNFSVPIFLCHFAHGYMKKLPGLNFQKCGNILTLREVLPVNDSQVKHFLLLEQIKIDKP
jgi:hypothetical protein